MGDIYVYIYIWLQTHTHITRLAHGHVCTHKQKHNQHTHSNASFFLQMEPLPDEIRRLPLSTKVMGGKTLRDAGRSASCGRTSCRAYKACRCTAVTSPSALIVVDHTFADFSQHIWFRGHTHLNIGNLGLALAFLH